MALNAAQLESDLLDMFETQADSPADAAQSFADIYISYAGAGMFGANSITVDGAHETALVAALLAGISIPAPSGAVFAAAWSAGVAAFWVGLVVAGMVQAGATTGASGAAALVGALTTAFAAPQTASQAAAALAGALHTATQTASATVSPPGGTVLPIT